MGLSTQVGGAALMAGCRWCWCVMALVCQGGCSENEIGAWQWTAALAPTTFPYHFGKAVTAPGDIYIAGDMSGGDEIFVSKLNSAGTLQWTRRRGSGDLATVVTAVDTDTAGNIYVAGRLGCTVQSCTGGSVDFYLMKFGPDGNWQWTRQNGTSAYDGATGVATDGSGNVYITGETHGDLDGQNHTGSSDIFLSKFSADGSWQWTRQQDTSTDDRATGVATDAYGNVYIAGGTGGDPEGQNHTGFFDICLSKFSADGNLQWTRQRGTSAYDRATGVATDGSGNVYITGETHGDLDGQAHAGSANVNGTADFFISKFSADGSWQWTRQQGTSANDIAKGLATDASGTVYVAGNVFFEGNMTCSEIFLSAFSAAGHWLWTRQEDRSGDCGFAMGVATEGGNCYVLGPTSVMKFDPTANTTTTTTTTAATASTAAFTRASAGWVVWLACLCHALWAIE